MFDAGGECIQSCANELFIVIYPLAPWIKPADCTSILLLEGYAWKDSPYMVEDYWI